MRYLFELSKEHKTIPVAEILSSLKADDIGYEILESNEDVLIIESKDQDLKNLAERLSYSFFVDEFLFSCSIKEIESKANLVKLSKPGSIAIKYKNRSKDLNSQEIVKSLARIFTKNRKVALENPDIEIRAMITDSKVYVGSKIHEIDRSKFEERKVQNRPFFSPISLHPRLARALVNLSAVGKNKTLLDPFCGTGGILIEAGIIGAKVVGSDVEEKMIEGCKKTLDFYKIKNYKLYCSDIGEIKNHVKKVDAVVTDMPYGKSTTTKGEKTDRLYARSFENISNLLKTGGKAVIGLSDKNSISVGEDYFSLVEKHDFRAHRSLTRYFAVYQK